MSREDKISIVLMSRPKLVNIVKVATDDVLDRLVDEVNKELERELFEAAFN